MSPSSHINYHCQVLPVSILLKILTQLQSNCNEMQLDNRYKSDFPQKSLTFAAPKPSWKYWPASLQSTIKVIPHRSKSLWNGKKKITIIIKKKKKTLIESESSDVAWFGSGKLPVDVSVLSAQGQTFCISSYLCLGITSSWGMFWGHNNRVHQVWIH